MDSRERKNEATLEGKDPQDLLPSSTENERNSRKFQRDTTSPKIEAPVVDEDDLSQGTESFLYFVRQQNIIEPRPHFSRQESSLESTGEDNAHVLPQSPAYSCESEKASPSQLRRKEHKCSRCNYVYGKKSRVERHERTHAGEKPYTCLECMKTFSSKYTLKRHELIHTREKPYACSSCDSRFATKAGFKRHELTHTKKPLKCSHCSYRCAKKYSLRSHLRIHTGILYKDEQLISCTLCPTKLVSENNLRRHMKIHERKAPIICDLCPSSFFERSSLGRHYMVHGKALGGEILSCVHCPFTCTRMANLRNHIAIHVKDKPFLCFLCPSSFAIEKVFLQHLGLHGNSRPCDRLSCTRCAFKSTCTSTFAKHAKIHINN